MCCYKILTQCVRYNKFTCDKYAHDNPDSQR